MALSLLKLIPNEQQPNEPQPQKSSTKNRQSSQNKQSERVNAQSSFMEPEDSAGSYQHTIFNPGAVT
jgi:hypothetical protein